MTRYGFEESCGSLRTVDTTSRVHVYHMPKKVSDGGYFANSLSSQCLSFEGISVNYRDSLNHALRHIDRHP